MLFRDPGFSNEPEHLKLTWIFASEKLFELSPSSRQGVFI